MRAFCQVLDSFPERTRLLLRERLELCTPFAQIAQDLAYPAADTARKAFYSAHAQLLLRLRERGIKAPGED
jgi:hypothetical protein